MHIALTVILKNYQGCKQCDKALSYHTYEAMNPEPPKCNNDM